MKGGDVMVKELYIKPEVKKETMEAKVLTATHGSPNGGNGGENPGGGLGGWWWKKNWH
jgi:hypothetical protein